MNLNKAFVIGNLTRDPELRSLPSGQGVASFALATNRFFTDKSGGKKQDTQFHNIVAFGRLADIAKQYLNKGSLVLIEGRIQNRSWDGPDGQKKYKTEIVAEAMQLGPRGMGGGARPDSGLPAQQPEQPTAGGPAKQTTDPIETINYDDAINPDEIPF